MSVFMHQVFHSNLHSLKRLEGGFSAISFRPFGMALFTYRPCFWAVRVRDRLPEPLRKIWSFSKAIFLTLKVVPGSKICSIVWVSFSDGSGLSELNSPESASCFSSGD
jgi:hypothetical protein